MTYNNELNHDIYGSSIHILFNTCNQTQPKTIACTSSISIVGRLSFFILSLITRLIPKKYVKYQFFVITCFINQSFSRII